jgi:wyosine [tRNA(Phe)-imidazoG37] synthetase (radical SAM superfamily)
MRSGRYIRIHYFILILSLFSKPAMATFLFDEIIFGPVKSRRLGVSLGINLLPVNRKLCNFDCIYCECGWSADIEKIKSQLPTRADVFTALDNKLSALITYAGNGEPTLHPEFHGIIDDSIALRTKYFPAARIAVLSNATTINRPDVKSALLKVDMNILKLDSAFNSTVKVHNQPNKHLDVAELINNLAGFGGKLIIQTLFLRGKFRETLINNTTEEELSAWLKAIEKIRPSEVMIYTISRDTPVGGELTKVPAGELAKIARRVEKLGIKTQVSA